VATNESFDPFSTADEGVFLDALLGETGLVFLEVVETFVLLGDEAALFNVDLEVTFFDAFGFGV